jgi:hypothetical protein
MVVIRANERECGATAVVLRGAWITRSTYVSTDIPDQWGAITMPIARSMPSARIAAIACGMNGSRMLHPQIGAERVRLARAGVQPVDEALGLRAGRVQQRETRWPIAAYRSWSSERCSGDGVRPPRMSE